MGSFDLTSAIYKLFYHSKLHTLNSSNNSLTNDLRCCNQFNHICNILQEVLES